MSKVISPLDALLEQMKQEDKVQSLERKALINEIKLMKEREKLGYSQPEQPQMQPQDYKIVITPTSSNIRKELSNYVWNDKKAGIPVDAFNHLIDAIRYAFDYQG